MNRRFVPAKKRGFALIIVLVLSVAAVIATYSVLESSVNARVAVVRTVDGDLSDAIAQAGLERTLSYLDAFGSADFDWVLDPNQDAACDTGAATFTPGTDGNQPVFTESGVVKNVIYPPGVASPDRRYTLVPYNGGAYLVRFDDDADDMTQDSQSDNWSAWTNNNIATGDPDCVEGNDQTGGTADVFGTGVENPLRDRNRSIWVEVIGIYPGTDPTNVRYKTVLRSLRTYEPPQTVAGIEVSGNIQAGGNSELLACSEVGSLRVGGNVQASGSGAVCACGESEADQWQPTPNDPAMSHCTDGAWGGSACRVPCAPGQLTDTPISVADPGDFINNPDGVDYYFDFNRPCLFYAGAGDAAGTPESLWFWDHDANRGPAGARCGDFENNGYTDGSTLPWPPNPAASGAAGALNVPANWQGCWTPLIKDATGTCTGWPGEATGTCGWTPNAIATTVDLGAVPVGAMTTFLTGLGFPSTAGMEMNKPNWGASCFIDYPPFSASPARYDCGGYCDGTRAVMTWQAGSVHGPGMFWVNTTGTASTDADILSAIPAGVYIHDTGTDWDPSGAGGEFNAANYPVPTAGNLSYPADFPLHGTQVASPRAGYPLMTMVFRGRSPDPQIGFWLGIGQGAANPISGDRGADYPSLIVDNGNFGVRGNANVAFAGSVYLTNGNMSWNGNGQVALFGEIHIPNGNWDLSGTGDYEWFYMDALQQPGGSAVGAPLVLRSRQ